MFFTHAKGKLLLTGEYFVLDGAWALAVPVRFGQTLQVIIGDDIGKIHWQSRNPDDSVWFEATFYWPDFQILQASDENTAHTLANLLRACQRQNPSFFMENQSFVVTTQNDFPREWGLGTSSTLIASLAQWIGVNPYQVLFETMGGSGYDIACAYADGPILYQLKAQTPFIQEAVLNGPTDHLYFVYLGKKQNSREGIARYRQQVKQNPELIETVSTLTQQFLSAATLEEWESLIREHELFIAQTLELPRAKDLYFQDYPGEIKSLGAWGGDFVLATSRMTADDTKQWFRERGFPVCFSWPEMF